MSSNYSVAGDKKMFKTYFKWILFLSSYLPLYAIVLYRAIIDGAKTMSYILMAFIVLSVVALIIFFLVVRSFEGTIFKVKSIDYHGSDSAAYLFTYIFPFITTNLGNLQDAIFLGFMFLLVGIIYVNTNMLFANPILNLIGYKTYRVEDNNNNLILLITKSKSIKTNGTINAVNIGTNIYLEK